MERVMDLKDLVDRVHKDVASESFQATPENKNPSPSDTTSQSSLACMGVENNSENGS